MHFRIFIYLHISSSPLHILCSSHLHISFYFHIFTSSHFQMSFSHPHIFSFSHLRISSSHLLIFTSADLIFTSANLHICTHLLHVLYLLSLGRGRCQRSLTKCNLFARNEGRSAKSVVNLGFYMLGGNPVAQNEVKLRLLMCVQVKAFLCKNVHV